MKITAGVIDEVQAIMRALDSIPHRLGAMVNGGVIQIAEDDSPVGVLTWDEGLDQWLFSPADGLSVYFYESTASAAALGGHGLMTGDLQ